MTKEKKNQFEEIIDQLMIDEVSGLDAEIKATLEGLSTNKKRMAILSILDKDRDMFMKIKNEIKNNELSKTEHIKNVVQMMREYVKVGDFERKSAGEVQTPLELVNDMLNTLPKEVWSNPELKWLDNSTGTGIFIAVIVERLMKGLSKFEIDEEKRYRHIMEEMIYVSELQSKNCFIYLCCFDPLDEYGLNIYNGSFLEKGFTDHMKDVWEVEKFDIIVMNPPYNQMLDMAFINKSYLIGDIILAVHPSTWLLDEKGIQKKFNDTKKLVKDDLISIKLFNGNKSFGIVLAVPCVFTYINKNEKHSGIKCIDLINNVDLVYDDIYQINKFSDVSIYLKLKKKIVDKCANNLISNKNKKGTFYVNLSQISGNVHTNNDKFMVKNDFYTVVIKNSSVEILPRMQYFGFDTKNEAENFLQFVKSKFVRFCLSIYKNNKNIHRGELGLIPWLDFTKVWDDKSLAKQFDLSSTEIEFINKNIPDYY